MCKKPEIRKKQPGKTRSFTSGLKAEPGAQSCFLSFAGWVLKSAPLKIHGFFTAVSACSLSFIVSFLAYLPGLILLQMSPFTLIELLLGNDFKQRGFEEEEHLCATNESRAGVGGVRNGFARSFRFNKRTET